MCHHPISVHLKHSRVEIGSGVIDRAVACEVYDAYWFTVHGVLLRVVQCEECANDVLFHTFVKVCSERGAKPTLSVLLRTAFAAACGAADETGNENVKDRIKAWYLEAQSLRNLPSSADETVPDRVLVRENVLSY
jgi:hypothetical protein